MSKPDDKPADDAVKREREAAEAEARMRIATLQAIIDRSPESTAAAIRAIADHGFSRQGLSNDRRQTEAEAMLRMLMTYPAK